MSAAVKGFYKSADRTLANFCAVCRNNRDEIEDADDWCHPQGDEREKNQDRVGGVSGSARNRVDSSHDV